MFVDARHSENNKNSVDGQEYHYNILLYFHGKIIRVFLIINLVCIRHGVARQ